MSGKTIAAVVATVGAALAVGYFIGRLGVPAGPKEPTAAVAPGTTLAPAGEAKGGQKKLLYYRNPMGLADTSPVPKKDPMGMDYIPVYEGEDQGPPGTVKVSADRIQTLGVRTEAASKRSLARVVRAVGNIEINERGQHTVVPEVRGLDREAARQHDRPGRRARPAARGGLQPGARVRAARIPDRLQRLEGHEQRRFGSAHRRAGPRRGRTRTPAQLGHQRTATGSDCVKAVKCGAR